MVISSKSKVAITALVDLAIHQTKGPVALKSIGQRIRISTSCLERVFESLRKEGLVTGKLGPGGGYSLKREACQIRLGDIARVFDPHNVSNYQPVESRVAEDLFAHLNQYAFKLLDSVTLQSLVSNVDLINLLV
jgi:Rrf2 family transcriptional regulator, iron-sulfur cluster assembly transcription factor